MEWDYIAPMLAVMTITLSLAGVLILRPLSKRLGDVIYFMQERKSVPQQEELKRVAHLLEALDDRVDRLEHRLDFSERLLTSRDHGEANAGRAETARRKN